MNEKWTVIGLCLAMAACSERSRSNRRQGTKEASGLITMARWLRKRGLQSLREGEAIVRVSPGNRHRAACGQPRQPGALVGSRTPTRMCWRRSGTE